MVFCTSMPSSGPARPTSVAKSRLATARASSAAPPKRQGRPPRIRSPSATVPTTRRAEGDQFSCRSSKRWPRRGTPPCSEETWPGSLWTASWFETRRTPGTCFTALSSAGTSCARIGPERLTSPQLTSTTMATLPTSVSSGRLSSRRRMRRLIACSPCARWRASRAVTSYASRTRRAACSALSCVRARRRRPFSGSRKYIASAPAAALKRMRFIEVSPGQENC